jgi:hypothetical protein
MSVKRGNGSQRYILRIVLFRYKAFGQFLSKESQGLENKSFSMKSDQGFQIEVRLYGHGLIDLYPALEAASFLVRPYVEEHLSRAQLQLFAEKYKDRKRWSRLE